VTVVVIGGTGPLGAEVVRALTERGVPVRAVTRRLDAPRPDGAELVTADLADPGALYAASAGAHRLFLLSSPRRGQVALETNGVDAAEGAGIEHIVKISNI